MKSSRTCTAASTCSRSRRPNVSPSSRHIKKASDEQRQRHKVEETLRRLVGGEDEINRLELLLATIEHIRQLEMQLKEDKENDMAIDVDDAHDGQRRAEETKGDEPHNTIPLHNLSLSCKSG